jgi:hypothetical protein
MKWIRLWTQETIDGTTFDELDAAERGIWFSLLLLAGLPPNEGIVELRKGVGYEPSHLAQKINVDPDLILPTITHLLEVKKVSLLPKSAGFPPEKIRLKIRNWNKYQTEYSRYRKGKTSKDLGTGYASGTPPLDSPPRQSKSKKQSKSESKKENGTPPAFAIEFQEEWNSHPELPQIVKMTAGRVKQLRIRRRDEDFCARWKVAIAALARSPFHTGRNDRNWRADVKWFLKNDDIWLSVLERNKDGNGTSGKYGQLCADD